MEAASMGKKLQKPRRAVLRLRDFDHSKASVLNSLGSFVHRYLPQRLHIVRRRNVVVATRVFMKQSHWFLSASSART